MQNPSLEIESYTRSSVVQSMSVPANSILAVSQYGQSFYFLGATSPIEVKTDLTAFKPYRKGTGEEFPNELRFKRLEIKNPNAYAVTVQIWIGFGKYLDNRFEVLDSYVKIVSALPAGSIAAATSLTLNGSPTGTQIQRKSIVVSNLDPTSDLVILDEDDDFVCAVFPRTSITLPISGVVKVRNTTGVSISCYVSEIWYVENAS